MSTDYVSRKEEGRGLAIIEDSFAASKQWLKDFIEKNGGKLITATKNNTDNTRMNRTKITWKEKWKEKQLYGHFKLLTNDISHKKTCTCLRKRNLRRETKSLQIVAQNNTEKTNYINTRIDKTHQNSKYRLCGDRDETINHKISECSKITQKECKNRLSGQGDPLGNVQEI